MDKNSGEYSVQELVTTVDVVSSEEEIVSGTRHATKYLLILAGIIALGLLIYSLLPNAEIDIIKLELARDGHRFYWMLLVGFLAEMIAGSMGMGYGVICTTILLILNVPPPVVSASIHSAESFTSAASTISHFKLGNVNKKLMKALAIPAVIGAVTGAFALSFLGEHYSKITKPFIAAYTMYLGFRILQNAFIKKRTNGNGKTTQRSKTNITRLGLIGGFIDSFGGGGWGPLVTGTFIKEGRTPRYVIGSSIAAKTILTVASAITFIFTIGIHHWNIVAGLLIGGIVTAPLSALLTVKLPTKKMFVIVGIVVIICSLISFVRAFI
ncbi:sulfite exporter TauE/SafE family protein [Ferruginibacter albus]|uniref:sulfite exporter TauE/SafE family protein n=1 Tax=Ferruginibacter albus TaxID=2875540 RepID=UPI001CC58DD6|nr:sulfite exporter TauE/SafE family protein [Ferruginibacter albus]UAY52989.1 sulfite exporter TauE/SafE family protein [Ferruginibacter albus]